MKIKAIGRLRMVQGFALAGVPGLVLRTADELNSALDELLAEKDLGMILISTDVALLARDRILAWQAQPEPPIIVELPAPDSDVDSIPSLREIVEDAVGIHRKESRQDGD